jgi:hypothetical protein
VARRANVIDRRDFLRTLGLAAGVSVPEVLTATQADAAAAPVASPTTPVPPSPGATASPTAPTAPTTQPPTTAPPTTQPPTDAPTSETPTSETPTSETPDAEPRAAGAPAPVMPSATDRHVLSRFSYGVSQSLITESAAQGGANAWFENQLQPGSIPDTYADGLVNWFPQLKLSPKQMYDESESGSGMTYFDQQGNFQRWSLLRRIYSKRQLHETMVEFWSNMLHVTAPLAKAFPWRVDYDTTLREHALGRFDELLLAAVLHPAMLCYLDNAESTQTAVNENLGRELLELHTVGREAEFTETDVRDSARILTGWHVDVKASWAASYVKLDHFIGPVKVLGFTAKNPSFEGAQVARDYVTYLARHPATATRVARRLAIRFVSDLPSEELVTYLAGVYTSSNTDISATLRALLTHPEFLASAGSKVRTPIEDACNTYRVLEVEMSKPTGVEGEAARTILSVCGDMGQKPFDWPTPDGFPDADDSWSSASRALGSWRVHNNTTHGTFPRLGVTYKPDSYYVPTLPIRFDGFVNTLSQRVLGMNATPQMQRASAKAVECLPDEYILSNSTLVNYRVPALVLSLLDTPQHMMR